VEAERENLEQAVRQTRELLANAQIPAIFEATFEHRNVLVRVDILQRRPQKKWRLIEVKSTSDIEDHHLHDIGIQRYVLSHCGIA
jgi:hypothetical protein